MRQSILAPATSRSISNRSHVLSRRELLNATIIAPFSSLIPEQPAGASQEPPNPTLAPRTCRFALDFDYLTSSQNGRNKALRVQLPIEVLTSTTSERADTEAPVVIFSPGFLQPAASYGTFLATLHDAGVTVVTYDKSFETLSSVVDDVDSVVLLNRVAAEVLVRLGPLAAGPLFLAGHSRGGKLSVLAAAAASHAASTATAESPVWPPAEPAAVADVTALRTTGHTRVDPEQQHQQHQQQRSMSVSGMILLDPADGSFEPQDPNHYPSALAALQNHPSLADVPMLIIGAGRGGDCVPRAKNFRAFFKACRGQCTMVTLQDAGHLQFLDRDSGSLQQSICAAGRGLSNSRVAAVGGKLAAAFLHQVADTSPAVMPKGGQPAESNSSNNALRGGGVSCSSSTIERLYEEQLREEGLRYEVQVSGCSKGLKG
ncbi:hypothetical protein VaNZ11_013210 [Volvox africanus]|uniref:Chlorophyllase n=1 Tax=Volvox africanus TaxID=51714 RepID=A0ABQ5SFP1_9CHLO|nr:hypothetical protein VaNZ11_013210 [Volvox africanus]